MALRKLRQHWLPAFTLSRLLSSASSPDPKPAEARFERLHATIDAFGLLRPTPVWNWQPLLRVQISASRASRPS